MDKHIEIWNKINLLLIRAIDFSNKKHFELYQMDGKNHDNIKTQRDYLAELSYEDRQSEFSQMNRYLDLEVKYKQKIQRISEYKNSPFFYRLQLNKKDIYISKYQSELEFNIVLFTAPVAEFRFYNIGSKIITLNNERTVEEKDKIIIDQSKLFEVEHEDKDGGYIFNGEKLQSRKLVQGDIIVNKSGLLDNRNEVVSQGNSKNKYVLSEIIDKMRKEQDEIMRAPVDGIILIKGAAGSGKTNIAIHRIVYLTNELPNKEHPDRKFNEENIAVFCYNISLKKYLQNLIQELNISRVTINSLDKWLLCILNKVSDIEEINYIEDESKFIKLTRKEQREKIVEFVKKKMQEVCSAIQDNEILSRFVNLNNELHNLHDLRVLCDNMFDKLVEYNGKGRKITDSDKTKAEKNLIKTELVKILLTYLCKSWSWKDDSKIKFNGSKILSEFYQFLNNDEFAHRYKYSVQIYNSDAIILAYIIRLLSEGLTVFPSFDHIVIDEVQDIAPLQMLLLNELHKNSMTIVGDVTQGIYNQGVKQWEDIGFSPNYVYELKLSHRSTLENILYANAVLSPNEQNTLAGEVAKRGEKPYVLKCENFDNTLKALVSYISNIKKTQNNDSIVVVYPKNDGLSQICNYLNKNRVDAYIAKKDDWLFTNKVNVTTYQQVKGLEFDYVFILGLNTFDRFQWDNKTNILYTVITRTQKRCYIFYENDLPKLIKNIDKDLYYHGLMTIKPRDA